MCISHKKSDFQYILLWPSDKQSNAMAVDFTKQMKRDFTILAPDIFPTHMELLQEVFALHGYHVEVLHDEGPAVIAAGLKYLHNDMCYPQLKIGEITSMGAASIRLRSLFAMLDES